MDISEQKINAVAEAIYNANWKELPGGNSPPVWNSVSNNVRQFVRRQAVAAISELEKHKNQEPAL